MSWITVKNTSHEAIYLGKKPNEIDSVLAPGEIRRIDEEMYAWTDTKSDVDMTEHVYLTVMEGNRGSLSKESVVTVVTGMCSSFAKILKDE